nr:hypothetical protein [Tanacetum cinerariifolium]
QAQPENSNELFQKLLEDLKELAEYDNSPSKDHSNFLNDDENHSVQNEEFLENSSNEIVASNFNKEKEKPPQDSDIRQLISEECCVEVCEEQKQKMENTILKLVEICLQKELLCIHDNVDDLIESALNSKILSINSNLQPLNKKEQEVKNDVQQSAKRRTRVGKLLQNFRVIHKNSISLNNTSQISPVHAVAPILSTEEPEHSLSMGECEVTSEDEIECDVPAKDDCSPTFTTFSNPLFNDNDNLDSSDDESLPEEDVSAEEFKVYSNPLFNEDEINSDKLDPYYFNVESDFFESLLNCDTFIDSSSKFDFFGELAHVNREIAESDFDFKEEIHLSENLLYDNSSSRPSEEHNADEERIKREHADYISRIEMLFIINPRPHPTMNVNTIIESLSSLPIPVQDGNSQRENIDIVTETDDVLPPSVENEDDSEGKIDVVEELLSDNFIPFTEDEASDSDYQDDPLFPRPSPEPPDAEFDFKPDAEKKILVVMNEKDEFDDENDDYFPFMFVIRIFLPYLICSKMFISFLSAESEDTIFDPGSQDLHILSWKLVWGDPYPLINIA